MPAVVPRCETTRPRRAGLPRPGRAAGATWRQSMAETVSASSASMKWLSPGSDRSACAAATTPSAIAAGPKTPLSRQVRASMLVAGRLSRCWSRQSASERRRARWSSSPLESNRRRGSSSMAPLPSLGVSFPAAQFVLERERERPRRTERCEQEIHREPCEFRGRRQGGTVIDVRGPGSVKLAPCPPANGRPGRQASTASGRSISATRGESASRHASAVRTWWPAGVRTSQNSGREVSRPNPSRSRA